MARILLNDKKTTIVVDECRVSGCDQRTTIEVDKAESRRVKACGAKFNWSYVFPAVPTGLCYYHTKQNAGLLGFKVEKRDKRWKGWVNDTPATKDSKYSFQRNPAGLVS